MHNLKFNKIKMLKRISSIAVFVFLAVLLYSCEKKSDTVIDPSYDSPVLTNLVKSPDTVKTTSGSPLISFYVSVVADENNGSPLKSVNCTLNDPFNGSLGKFQLNYSGDTATGKKYTGTVSVSNVSCLLVGNYTIQVIAENESGLNSNMLSSILFVKNTSNQAPVMSNPVLPDSVIRPLTGSFDLTLYVTATDSDGPCDIAFVYMDAYRPSGSYISRFVMNPAGNNVYSYTNSVTYSPADSSYGYYKYNFTAVDRSDVFSTILKDSIKFVRPN